MSRVGGRLRTPLQGALAGGGDPASSPLYVFGPALRLLVTAGVAKVAFGATLWLVVLTFFVVSAMYRRVMIWVTDGSGGSGLSGEEFGDTAVKLSASIEFIEYTLTFLVSMAALVTFIADRVPALNDVGIVVENRTWLAVTLSATVAWLVNRGPRMTSRAFGPATAAVLVLLWVMIAATIFRTGVHLPPLRIAAFEPGTVGITMGGYVRLLAAMTGVEVFANLVGAFEGPPAVRSRKAFRGLLIVMVSTGATMLIVGPAVQRYADPFNPDVSVFTQTMDALLPHWLARVGTLVSVAVLLSACAASAIGLQNLFVGLRLRHFIPAPIGRINRFGVADRPVWIEAGVASICFLVVGTREDTYLALYAAGVFVLLAMTGWAAMTRLVREYRARTLPNAQSGRPAGISALVGTGLAATLTTAATITIFAERFTDGAWTYFVMVPTLMLTLGLFRRSLGPPTVIEEQVGAAMGGGTVSTATERLDQISTGLLPSRVVVALDDTDHARSALAPARAMAAAFGSELSGVTVGAPAAVPSPDHASDDHGHDLGHDLNDHLGFEIEFLQPSTSVATALCSIADRPGHLLVMSTHGRSGPRRTVMGSVAAGVIRGATNPVLIVPPTVSSAVSSADGPDLSRILVPLDGSTDAELVLVHVSAIASLDSVVEVILAHIPSGGTELVPAMEAYLERIASSLEHTGTRRVVVVQGHAPAASIPSLARELDADLVMMTTHGRSGVGRHILGSVAEDIIRTCPVPVFVVPVANQVRVRRGRVPSGRGRQPPED